SAPRRPALRRWCTEEPSEGFQLLREHGDRAADLLARVLAADEEAQPRAVLLHRRVDDGLHVDAALVQRLRQARGADRAAGDGRDDGIALARAGADAGLAREAQELAPALLQPLHPLGLGQHALER